MRDVILVNLNPEWRVTTDGIQWILQFRWRGGWQARRFHLERDYLLKSIAELCGGVDERALATIRSWPKHFDRMMVRAETMVSA